jgi:hypothetical protein
MFHSFLLLFFSSFHPFLGHLSPRHADTVVTGCTTLPVVHLSAVKNRTNREGPICRLVLTWCVWEKEKLFVGRIFSVSFVLPRSKAVLLPLKAHC